MTLFEKELKRLNTAQRKAVDSIEGPVMVVAGPGTGKTQILTLRIANILARTDTPADSILALTFTEAAAANMRRRLVSLISSPAYAVAIHTFHGFCNDIINTYPEKFPKIIGSQNITEVEQIQIIRRILIKSKLKHLKPYGDALYYARPIFSGIGELKRQGMSPSRFRKIILEEEADFKNISDLIYTQGMHSGKMRGKYQKVQRRIEKNKELAVVYRAYQKSLADMRLYDYNDMIMEVLKTLSKDSEFLLVLQERYQYILVDEHQDTNNAQNKILELLGNFHSNPNIFVVGDEKQAIFRFQGASLENFLYFKSQYPQAELITLEQNYRSTQNILDTAHSLIAGPKKLKANTRHKSRHIAVHAFSRPEVQHYFLAQDIKKMLNRGVSPGEIAVIYRDNRDAYLPSKVLDMMGIPFSIQSDHDILSDQDIKKLLLLLNAVHDFGSQESFLTALHIDFLKIDPLDIYKIVEFANRKKVSVFEISGSKNILDSLSLATSSRLHKFYKKLSSWVILAKNRDFPEFFEILVRESGFLAYILGSKKPIEKMDKLNALYEEIKTLVGAHRETGLEEFFEYLHTLEAHQVSLKKHSLSSLSSRIRLMTAHRSKGLEFAYVYIIDAYDTHWGNKRRYSVLPLPPRIYSLSGSKDLEKNDMEDERRLFYVALTRAKKSINICFANENSHGRKQLPCQFINEIKSELIKFADVDKYEHDFTENRELLFAPPRTPGANIKDKEFIKELFIRNGLSVTALNNYLACPWKYFYNNLLRIPKAETKQQLYGQAVHASLRDFFEKMKEEKVEKKFLLNMLAHYLRQKPLSVRDFEETLKKGKHALGGYFDAYKASWTEQVLTEFSIAGIMLDKDIRLTGKIDKLEFLGEGNAVNVVDYKTSKPKSRNEIEGSTKNSNGDLKRQLVFYNLLLNYYENGRYRMVSGDIDFVEPDSKDRYKKERFSIVHQEVVELETLIKNTAQEIMNLTFWNTKCDDKKCTYCSLRDLMQ